MKREGEECVAMLKVVDGVFLTRRGDIWDKRAVYDNGH